MAQTTLTVEGMHCPSCEMRVKIALEDLPGVQEATASHENNSVEIVFDESADQSQFAPAIEAEGFQVIG